MKPNDEIELTKRIREGDKKAFECLFRNYYAGLVVYVKQIILQQEEAEEIVQEFFAWLWENKKLLIPAKSIKSFLFISVKNRALNHLKRIKVKKQVVEQLEILINTHQLYELDIFMELELVDRIKQTVDKLPKRCGEIFTMSRFDGIRNSGIAERLNIKKRTVEIQISNALKVLRVNLKEYMNLFYL